MALVILLTLSIFFGAASLRAMPRKDRDSSPALTADEGQDKSNLHDEAVASQMPQDRQLPLPQTIRLSVLPENPRPGEPITVALWLPPHLESTTRYAAQLFQEGVALGRAFFFSLDAGPASVPFIEAPSEIPSVATGAMEPLPPGALAVALLAIPSTAKPGAAYIRVAPSLPDMPQLIIASEEPPTAGFPPDAFPLIIQERQFLSEVLQLDPVNTDIRTVPDPQKTAESNQLWAILNRSNTEIYALEAFIPPTAATRRTSFYGSRRVYQYSTGLRDTTIHAGVDYGIPRGSPVTASAPGRVILARFRIVTGNTIILEHLPGVYSLYYHLDSIAIAESSMVHAGDFLGESGSTGLATGPHLHWEIRIAGENADPDALITQPLLDKTAIISKIIQ